MTSAIYASLAAFLLVWLSLNVIKTRRRLKVRYGDGGKEELQIARAAHSNAAEYIPIALLLLFALEYNHASIWLVHVFGVVFLVARVIHAYGLLSGKLRGRVLGMQITLFTLLALAVANLMHIPYKNISPL